MYVQWIDTLIKIPLFKNIAKDDLITLMNCLEPRIITYEEKMLIQMGQSETPEVGIVLTGEVDVVKENFSGDRVLLSRLKGGELFGGMSAFSGRKLLATIEPTKQSTILFMSANKIISVCPRGCSGHEILIRNMLEIISRKALALNRKVEILSFKSIRQRISLFLLQQFTIEKTATFNITLKRYELAEYLNTTRPSLSRELIKMKEEGIIDFYKNSFQITNLEKLKQCLVTK